MLAAGVHSEDGAVPLPSISQTCSDRSQVAADFPAVFPSPESEVTYTASFGTDSGNTIVVPNSLVQLRPTVIGAGEGRKISYVAGSRVARHVLTRAPADLVAAGGSSSAKSCEAAQLYATTIAKAVALAAKEKQAATKTGSRSTSTSSSLVSSLSLVRATSMLAKSSSGTAADKTVLNEAGAVMAAFHQAVTSTYTANAKVVSMGAIAPFQAVEEAARTSRGAGKQWAAAVYDFTSYVLSLPPSTVKGPATQHTIKVVTPQTNLAPVKALTGYKALVQSSVFVPRRSAYAHSNVCTEIHNPTSLIAIGKVMISSSGMPPKDASFQIATTIQTSPTGATEKALAAELAGKYNVDITQTFQFKLMPGCSPGGVEPAAFVSAATCYLRESPKKSLQDDAFFDLDFAMPDSIEGYSADDDDVEMSIDEDEFEEDDE
ncbi:hypothetical protein BC828DRAFT_413555 [Blastocladiella britannica]|nr:hypothetical protein BC828DRAFT_413555 [Blastocladiella britannica]